MSHDPAAPGSPSLPGPASTGGAARRPASSARGFDQVRHYRAFEVISDEVRRRILDGQLSGGDRLPSERELAQQFGVSRATLREAFRVLESLGLIESRMGLGRFVVRIPVNEPASADVSVDERALLAFFEFLMGIEPYLAALAAKRATTDDLDAMRESLNATESGAAENAAVDTRFHLTVTEAAHNVVAREVLHSERLGLYWADIWVSVLPSARSSIAEEHHAVFDAIEARDEAAARAAMTRHLEAATRRVREATRLQAHPTGEPHERSDGAPS